MKIVKYRTNGKNKVNKFIIFIFTFLYLTPGTLKIKYFTMKNAFLKICLLLIVISLFSCEAEDMQGVEEYNSRMLNAFIYDSDIVGEWDLQNIYSANPVDLNGDGVLNNDLLSEVSCFDPVQIIFKGDKTFSSINSRMDIKLVDGKVEYSCNSSTAENGIWSLKNNTITFYVARGGVMVKFDRQIMLTDNSFIFEVDPSGSGDYVKDPRGNSAAAVSIVALEFVVSPKS